MTYDEWVRAAVAYYLANPFQRVGQAYFNSLRKCRGFDFAQSIVHDPFYVANGDSVPLVQFFEEVKEKW